MPVTVLRIAGFCAAALIGTLAAQAVWSALLGANLKISPAVPWSVPFMALLLVAGWLYAGGAGWPRSASAARRIYRRAKPLPAAVFARATLAGLLGLVALVAFWLILVQVVTIPASRVNLAAYPPLSAAVLVLTASVVGSVTEEVGLRGYMLTRLERVLPGWLAVAVVALVISPGHGLTQGFVWPVLAWYLAVDTLLGSLAMTSGSILPGLLVHAIGLLVFFTVVWPVAATLHPTSLGAQGSAFCAELAAGVLFGGLSVVALRRVGMPPA